MGSLSSNRSEARVSGAGKSSDSEKRGLLEQLEELAASYARLYAQTGAPSWLKRLKETRSHIKRLRKARRMPQERDE